MVHRSEGYTGKRHLVWRNLLGLILGGLFFLVVWFGCEGLYPWWLRLFLGLVMGGFCWLGTMFVTAKGA